MRTLMKKANFRFSKHTEASLKDLQRIERICNDETGLAAVSIQQEIVPYSTSNLSRDPNPSICTSER